MDGWMDGLIRGREREGECHVPPNQMQSYPIIRLAHLARAHLANPFGGIMKLKKYLLDSSCTRVVLLLASMHCVL